MGSKLHALQWQAQLTKKFEQLLLADVALRKGSCSYIKHPGLLLTAPFQQP